MTWQDDPEGRMIVLIFGMAFAGMVLLVCSTVVTSVVAFVVIVGMLLAFLLTLALVP